MSLIVRWGIVKTIFPLPERVTVPLFSRFLPVRSTALSCPVERKTVVLSVAADTFGTRLIVAPVAVVRDVRFE